MDDAALFDPASEFTAGQNTAPGITPALDFRRAAAEPETPPPASLEAEQALLGCLLYEPDLWHRMPDGLLPRHFVEPVHSRVFHVIGQLVAANQVVDAIQVHLELRTDEGLTGLGGLGYLVDLVDKAPPGANAPGYAATVLDCAVRRGLLRTAQELAQAAIGGGKGAEVAETFAHRLEAIGAGGTTLQLVSAQAASDEVMAHIDEDPGQVTAVGSGIVTLDRQLGPMLPGDLILLGGRPGMGKSTVAAEVMLNTSGPGLPLLEPGLSDEERWALRQQMRPAMGVVHINGEMPVKQSTWRMLASIAFRLYGHRAPTYNRIRRHNRPAPTLTPEQIGMLREAKGVFDQLPLRQIKRTGLRLAQVVSLCRRAAIDFERQGVPLGLVVIDHAGLLEAEGRVTSDYEAQSQIAVGSKTMADRLGIPALMLLQLNRDVEKRDDKRPQAADLRASGKWEENADAILLAYRPAYYAQQERQPDERDLLKWQDWDARRKSHDLELILGKVRDGADVRSVTTWCDIGHNVVRGHEPPMAALAGGLLNRNQ